MTKKYKYEVRLIDTNGLVAKYETFIEADKHKERINLYNKKTIATTIIK